MMVRGRQREIGKERSRWPWAMHVDVHPRTIDGAPHPQGRNTTHAHITREASGSTSKPTAWSAALRCPPPSLHHCINAHLVVSMVTSCTVLNATPQK